MVIQHQQRCSLIFSASPPVPSYAYAPVLQPKTDTPADVCSSLLPLHNQPSTDRACAPLNLGDHTPLHADAPLLDVRPRGSPAWARRGCRGQRGTGSGRCAQLLGGKIGLGRAEIQPRGSPPLSHSSANHGSVERTAGGGGARPLYSSPLTPRRALLGSVEKSASGGGVYVHDVLPAGAPSFLCSDARPGLGRFVLFAPFGLPRATAHLSLSSCSCRHGRAASALAPPLCRASFAHGAIATALLLILSRRASPPARPLLHGHTITSLHRFLCRGASTASCAPAPTATLVLVQFTGDATIGWPAMAMLIHAPAPAVLAQVPFPLYPRRKQQLHRTTMALRVSLSSATSWSPALISLCSAAASMGSSMRNAGTARVPSWMARLSRRGRRPRHITPSLAHAA